MGLKLCIIEIRKGQDFKMIMVREDKKVWFNFGDDHFFEFEKMNDKKVLNNLKSNEKKRKYSTWLESKKFKRDWAETKEVIDSSDNYEVIISKFIHDFRSDRGNKINKQYFEVDPNKKVEEVEYEYKR